MVTEKIRSQIEAVETNFLDRAFRQILRDRLKGTDVQGEWKKSAELVQASDHPAMTNIQFNLISWEDVVVLGNTRIDLVDIFKKDILTFLSTKSSGNKLVGFHLPAWVSAFLSCACWPAVKLSWPTEHLHWTEAFLIGTTFAVPVTNQSKCLMWKKVTQENYRTALQ